MDYRYTLTVSIVAIGMLITAYSYRARRYRLMSLGISKMSNVVCSQTESNSKVYEKISNRSKFRQIVLIGERANQRLRESAAFLCSPLFRQSEFVDWLRYSTTRKSKSDTEYVNRVTLRNIRKMHRDSLQEVEMAVSAARHAFRSSEDASRIESIETNLKNSVLALENMKKYVTINFISESVETESLSPSLETLKTITNRQNRSYFDTSGSKQDQLQIKLNRVIEMIPNKELEVMNLQNELEILKRQTPEYNELKSAVEKVDKYHEDIGINNANKIIKSSQQHSGRGRNERGYNFENAAEKILNEYLLPSLSKEHNIEISDLLVVRNVKFGMASQKGSTAEIDCLICSKAPRPPALLQSSTSVPKSGEFCIVLGVVEVKRNADDIGDAFCNYQLALNWLCGNEDAYNPEYWRTKLYPRGHFDRPFVHSANGENLIFTRDSFAGLRRYDVSYPLLPSSTSGHSDSNAELENTPPVQNDCVDCIPASLHDSLSMRSTSPSHLTKDDGYEMRETSENSNFVFNNNTSHQTDDMISSKLFVQKLYFVTKDAKLECMPSKVLNWVLHQVASGEQFDDEISDSCQEEVEKLRLAAIEKFPCRWSTLDVLRLYELYHFENHFFVVGAEEIPSDDIIENEKL